MHVINTIVLQNFQNYASYFGLQNYGPQKKFRKRSYFGVAVLPKMDALRPLSEGDIPLLPFPSCIRASQGRRESRFTCVETSNWSEAIPSTKLCRGSGTISAPPYSPANSFAWMGKQKFSGFSMGSISHSSTPSKRSNSIYIQTGIWAMSYHAFEKKMRTNWIAPPNLHITQVALVESRRKGRAKAPRRSSHRQ